MKYKDESDLALWKRCRQDDVRAYNELFRRYDRKLCRLASRYIKDPMQAEELALDVLCNLWTRRAGINITADLSNYLFRTMRNVVINQLKKKLPQMLGLEELKQADHLDRPADFRLREKETGQLYQETLDTLSPQRRKVFTLSREENFTYGEIADELGLSVTTVKQHMISALKTVRTAINENVLTALIAGLFSLPQIF